mmetsp:Transcript_31783/g.69489  ORF Transcript_31783/g.69489 Transcript_31783/m.69489 type:complete len:289 (+) Transcript_31783:102-968(+)
MATERGLLIGFSQMLRLERLDEAPGREAHLVAARSLRWSLDDANLPIQVLAGLTGETAEQHSPSWDKDPGPSLRLRGCLWSHWRPCWQLHEDDRLVISPLLHWSPVVLAGAASRDQLATNLLQGRARFEPFGNHLGHLLVGTLLKDPIASEYKQLLWSALERGARAVWVCAHLLPLGRQRRVRLEGEVAEGPRQVQRPIYAVARPHLHHLATSPLNATALLGVLRLVVVGKRIGPSVANEHGAGVSQIGHVNLPRDEVHNSNTCCRTAGNEGMESPRYQSAKSATAVS